MSVYAIVPARGGSKGISRKNLRPVAGSPLVARTVHAARRAASVDRVFVTTDDTEIARVAAEAGAEIIDRPAALSGDDARSEAALLHALDVFVRSGVEEPEIAVMLQCTSPFTTPDDVDGTVGLVAQGAADCAFTAARSHAFLWEIGPDGAVPLNHDASTRPRRQELAPQFVETGGVYAMRTTGLRRAEHRFFGRIAIYEVAADRALEIDEPGDLALAEACASPHAITVLPSPVAALVLDFDGVLTDNRVVTLSNGLEAVISDRSDGFGLELLRTSGVPVVVISKERNPVVAVRCEKLRVECRQGIDDKPTALQAWMAEHDLDPARVVFVGNDVNDVECLQLAGCGVVPADAHPLARNVADLVLSSNGGRGAVRELIDLILESRMGAR